MTRVVSGGGWLLGLREDGTVISWGASGGLEGQTQVEDWTGIVDIAACSQAALGIKEDGTVLVAGSCSGDGADGRETSGGASDWLEEIAGWSGIRQAVITEDLALGLREDGTVAAAGALAENLNLSEWTQIDFLAAGNGEAVGVKEDGTVLSTKRTLNSTAAATAAVGGDYVVLVSEDGSAQVSGTNGGAANVYSWKDIVQAAAGKNHTVGLKSDGTVVAAGANENGQCEIGGWTDVVYIAAGDYYTLGVQSDGALLIAGKLPGEF